MADTCPDVCDEVIRRLKSIGFELGDDGNHQPIFDALALVRFSRTDKSIALSARDVYTDQNHLNRSDDMPYHTAKAIYEVAAQLAALRETIEIKEGK